jgi:hypothetical protein
MPFNQLRPRARSGGPARGADFAGRLDDHDWLFLCFAAAGLLKDQHESRGRRRDSRVREGSASASPQPSGLGAMAAHPGGAS